MYGARQTTLLKAPGWDPEKTASYVWLVDWKKYGHNRCNVYVIAPETKWPSKIGIAGCVLKRLQNLQTSHWQPLKVMHAWWTENASAARAVELKAHEMLQMDEAGLLGEWFDRTSDKAAEVVEFAAASVGVEINTTIDDPKIISDLSAVVRVGAFNDTVAKRLQAKHDNDGFPDDDPNPDSRPPEQRWADAEARRKRA